MEIKVKSNYIKTSPRKLRLLTNLVKKCQISDAINQIKFSGKQIKYPLIHLLKSSVAAAKEKGLDEEKLYVKSITCNQGPALKRVIFWSKGRAKRIKKRMSHVTLIVTDNAKTEKSSIKETKSNKGKE